MRHVTCSCAKAVTSVGCLFTLTATSAISLAAQHPTVVSRRPSPISRDMRYCEWMLKDLEKRSKKTPEQRLAWTQIREDFEQIQVNNNSLLTARSYGGNPDPKLIEKTSAEINKRATRLNSNMMLPAGGANEKRTPVQEDNLQMKTLLAALDGLIVRFVTNPIFKDTNVVDVQFSSKAKHDLERIIELSDRVRKKAHKMGEKL